MSCLRLNASPELLRQLRFAELKSKLRMNRRHVVASQLLLDMESSFLLTRWWRTIILSSNPLSRLVTAPFFRSTRWE